MTEKTLADEVDRVKTERKSWEKELRTLKSRKLTWLTLKKQALTLEDYCRRASRNIERFTYEQKWQVLEALDTEVRVDGEAVTIVGYIPHDIKRADPPPHPRPLTPPPPLPGISQEMWNADKQAISFELPIGVYHKSRGT